MTSLLVRFRTQLTILVIALVVAGVYFGYFKGQFGTTVSTANRIVFLATATRSASASDIYTVNPDGSGLLKVSRDTKTQGADPTWNKDKTNLFYAANIAHYQIMRMDPYGNLPTILTFGATEKSAPAVSPDGKKVAFVDEVKADKKDLAVYDFTTGVVTKLETTGINLAPSWASNTKLLYIRQDSQGNNSLYSVEGTTETNLTPGLKIAHTFGISPDGQTVAFVNKDDNQLYTISVTGTGKKVITSQKDGKLGSPSWSPDGKEVAAILTPTNKDPELVRIQISSGTITQVKISDSIFNPASPNWTRR